MAIFFFIKWCIALMMMTSLIIYMRKIKRQNLWMYNRPHFYTGHLVFYLQKKSSHAFRFLKLSKKNWTGRDKSIPVCVYIKTCKSTWSKMHRRMIIMHKKKFAKKPRSSRQLSKHKFGPEGNILSKLDSIVNFLGPFKKFRQIVKALYFWIYHSVNKDVGILYKSFLNFGYQNHVLLHMF